MEKYLLVLTLIIVGLTAYWVEDITFKIRDILQQLNRMEDEIFNISKRIEKTKKD